MSFLKIKDQSKRDKLVAEYLKTNNKIQEDFCSERLGEQSMYEDFGKIFKPIPEQQQKSSEEIVSKLEPLHGAIENMPALQALPWEPGLREIQPFLPSETSEEKLESLLEKKSNIPINVGPIALKNSNKYFTKDMGDSTYGLKNDGNEYYLGKTKIDFKGDNIKNGEKT